MTEALRAADSPGPVQVGAHVARPFAAGLGQLVRDPYARPGAGVGADEQGGAALGGAQLWVQAGAALEGFFCDDGCVVSLGPTHGAFDGGRPVLVGAVLTAPLQAQICHPRVRRSPQLISPLPPTHLFSVLHRFSPAQERSASSFSCKNDKWVRFSF